MNVTITGHDGDRVSVSVKTTDDYANVSMRRPSLWRALKLWLLVGWEMFVAIRRHDIAR